MQIRVVLHSAESASLDFMAKPVNGENLNADGTRPGLFRACIRSVGISSSRDKLKLISFQASEARNWTTSPLQSWTVNTSYRFEDWIIKADLDFEEQLNTDIFSGGFLPETDVYKVKWSIEANPPTTPVRHIAWSSDSDVVMDLFNDESASNVVFVIGSHEEGSEPEQLIYAHTKVLCARSNYFKKSKHFCSSGYVQLNRY